MNRMAQQRKVGKKVDSVFILIPPGQTGGKNKQKTHVDQEYVHI